MAIWSAIQVVAESKFITIFAFLFGAGIVLMTSRLETRGVATGRLHYRRMLWLLLFGAIHAYLLWDGDILVVYAICGMLIYPARRLSSRTLATLGIGALAVAMSGAITTGLFWASGSDDVTREWLRYCARSSGFGDR